MAVLLEPEVEVVAVVRQAAAVVVVFPLVALVAKWVLLNYS
jgi:hypothetical protein